MPSEEGAITDNDSKYNTLYKYFNALKVMFRHLFKSLSQYQADEVKVKLVVCEIVGKIIDRTLLSVH